MNFKTILSVSALAFLSVVNAAPVSKNLEALKSDCKSQKGMLFNGNGSDYVCIQPNRNNVNLENSACINLNQQIFCVNENITSIDECVRSSDNYNYDVCFEKLGQITPLTPYPIISFSKKDEAKFAKNKKNCINGLGIYLEWDDDKKLNACLYPEYNFKSLDDEHCVTIKKEKESSLELHGIKYCVVEDMTTIPACKKSHEHYDYNGCSRFLDAMASFQSMDISI